MIKFLLRFLYNKATISVQTFVYARLQATLYTFAEFN